MRKIYHFLFVGFLAFSMFACSQNESNFGPFIADTRPAVPVTFEGATTFGFNPYLLRPLSQGTKIDIKMNIPASSGRTIKEIKRVAVGNTSLQPGYMNVPANVFLKTNISASGTSASLSTTLEEIKTKYPTLNVAAGTPYREIRFLFLVVLDNGDEIIPVPLDVRISQ